MRILLIEDEDSIRTALERSFERDGHDVRSAASLAAGRAILDSWSPELAVSDLKLPDGSGLELAGSLGVPFIMVSGYATYDDAVSAMRMGAVDFFTKPVAIKDIRLAIARAQRGQRIPTSCTWQDERTAREESCRLLAQTSGLVARCVVAEFAQATARGLLQVVEDQRGWNVWLNAQVDWSTQIDRVAWLRAQGVELVHGPCGAIAQVPTEIRSRYDPALEVYWQQSVKEDAPVRCANLLGVGSWLLGELRTHKGHASGLHMRLVAVCAACGISVQLVPETLIQRGVGADERAGLLAADDLGAPVA
ncbi:MAG: response regulator [Planctomycetota bacterium]